MASPLVAALVRAQQAANLSNRRLAALLGVSPSAISHYVSGASTPSLDVLTRWAEAVDVRLAVVEQHAGAVAELATLAEDLTRDELAALQRVAEALLASRDRPAARAVVAAALAMAAAQVQDQAAPLFAVR